MATNPHWKRAIGFGKRLSDRICASGPAVRGAAAPYWPAVSAAATRGVHASAYDKNPDDHVCPAFVPDDVIQLQSPGKYWGPHPATGVFGPDTSAAASASAGAASLGSGGGSPVPDQKAWFRPLEGVDHPDFF